MALAAPEYLPDPSASTTEMQAVQREVAGAATFLDRGCPDPASVAFDDHLDLPALPTDRPALGDAAVVHHASAVGPVVVGVDQAFRDAEALSVAVAIAAETVVGVAVARRSLAFPYVPGLLSFREAPVAVAAIEALPVEPDLLVIDGSGRIHYRQAGLATHLGVIFDRPALGATKNLLCGQPVTPLAAPLPEGARVPIEADDDVERITVAERPDPDWPVIGEVVQTRQYADTARRHVNPLYVSPGHRCRAATAGKVALGMAAGYKLLEPIRVADRLADRVNW